MSLSERLKRVAERLPGRAGGGAGGRAGGPELTSHADVATGSAERYAKQLASHLGRKAEVTTEPAGTRIHVGEGSCLLVVGPEVLELRAQAPSEEALGTVEDVVGRHLERFGQRNELTVAWVRDAV